MPAAFCTRRWTQRAERGGRTATQGGRQGVFAVFQSSWRGAEGAATAVMAATAVIAALRHITELTLVYQ